MKKNIFGFLSKIFKRENLFFLSVGIFLLVLIIILVFLFLISPAKNSGQELSFFDLSNKPEKNNDCVKRSSFTGECLKENELENPYIAAVMIENQSDSRPPSGLSKAKLVFEAEAEGKITRFLAFFPLDQAVEKIGPVRSSRPYYLNWTKEFDALYAHVGGSPKALEEIDQMQIEDLDQFFWSQYFWRSKDRLAPHNVYTSTELLKEAAAKKNIDLAKEYLYDSWMFKKDLDLNSRPDEVKDLIVNFSEGSEYKVEWKYNKEKNNYSRYLNKEKHLDEDLSEIFANNICVLYAEYYPIDDYGRLEMKNIGQGKALIFQDGQSFSGTWKKDSTESRLKFYLENGEEVKFNPGATWIEVVNESVQVEYQ